MVVAHASASTMDPANLWSSSGESTKSLKVVSAEEELLALKDAVPDGVKEGKDEEELCASAPSAKGAIARRVE